MINRLFYCLFFIIFSCSSKDKAPSEIIQPNEMKSVLWDVISAQNLAIEVNQRDTSLKLIPETKMLTQKVFEIHKINAAEFNKSYDWYIKHPETMKLILDSLYAQKQRENILNSKHKSLRDSFQKKIPL